MQMSVSADPEKGYTQDIIFFPFPLNSPHHPPSTPPLTRAFGLVMKLHLCVIFSSAAPTLKTVLQHFSPTLLRDERKVQFPLLGSANSSPLSFDTGSQNQQALSQGSKR